MMDRDAFAERGRALEEEYFRKHEQELIEKLRQRAAADATRQQLSEQLGVADKEILHDLQELGYTPETVSLLHVVPLVQMAWADGGVSDRERTLIVEAARARGIDAGTPADAQLAQWLTARPPEGLFDRTLRAIQAILELRPAAEREASRRDLLSYSTAIAQASGGVLGFRAVSPEERAVLARISSALQSRQGPAEAD
jgi:tellurite resistance protein